MNRISIPKHEWDDLLIQLLSSFDIYAPVESDFNCDYRKLGPDTISEIVYNKPKPVTPLKKFILPVKENVTTGNAPERPIIILGVPNCDVMAQTFLDQIYLDEDYPDPTYRDRRDNCLIISTDCLSIQEHCHCTSYGFQPVGDDHSDLALVSLENQIMLTSFGKRGAEFIEKLGAGNSSEPSGELLESLAGKQAQVLDQLKEQNKNLPDYETTGQLVLNANGIWEKYSSTCVSCGACSAICPSCSCFLLIDRPGFEKVRQLDTCQYPGFERVAGGEDALGPLPHRFKNRYMCKYVWKPAKYDLKACTGCGRCIETCIGKINKNELFVELST